MDAKYCNLRWCIAAGSGTFYVVQCDENGIDFTPAQQNSSPYLNELASLWLDGSELMRAWENSMQQGAGAFGDAAAGILARNGWTVIQNEFSSDLPPHSQNKAIVAEAEMTPSEIAEFKRKLYAGYVHFKYRKVGKPAKINRRTGVVTPEVLGEIREAWGTLNPAIIEHTIEQVESAEKKQHIPNETVIVYFDRDAVDFKTGQQGAFRCFKRSNFEGYIS